MVNETYRPVTPSCGIIDLHINSACKYAEVFNQLITNIKVMNKKINFNSVIYFIKKNRLRNDKIFENITNDLKENLYFMMIMRKNSIEYTEMVKGKYDVDNKNTYDRLLGFITKNEIKYLKENNFEDIWNNLWGSDNFDKSSKIKNRYVEEFKQSMKKFDLLNKSIFDENKTIYTEQEWGFPKGKKNRTESNLKCAIREFEEETGLKSNEMDSDYDILRDMTSIVECFTGTNGLFYKHIYYLAISPKMVKLDMSKVVSSHEIGAIKWLNFYDSFKKIRHYHFHKREIIENIVLFFAFLIYNCITKSLYLSYNPKPQLL